MTIDDWIDLLTSSTRIRERAAITRIAHHYFFVKGCTMARFPLHHFDCWQHHVNHAKLMRVVAAEREAGRFDDWSAGIGTPAKPYPEPFEHLVDRMFSTFDTR